MNFTFKITKLFLFLLLTITLISCSGKEERKIKYLEKGKVFLLEENYIKADIEFNNALQIDAKYADVYFYKAQIQEKTNDLVVAIAFYNKSIELNSHYSEAKIKLAKIYVLVGTDDFLLKAKNLLVEVKQDAPSNLEAALVSASIDYKAGNKTTAIKNIKAAIKKDKNLYEGVSLLAFIYMAEGDYLNAEKILTQGVNDNIDNIDLRISLSKLYVKNKNYIAAEKHLKEVVRLEPSDYSLRITLARFYTVSNQLKNAENVLRQAIRDDSDDEKRYLGLIDFFVTNEGFDKAISELKSFIKNKPDLYDLQFYLVTLYDKSDKNSEAKLILTNVIKNKSYAPEGVEARNRLAMMYLIEGSISNASSYIKDILDEYPTNIDALLTKGRLSLVAYDMISAINELRSVLKSDPKKSEASLLLAQAHEMNNEPLLSGKVLKKAIENSPLDYKTHVNYASFLITKDMPTEALDVVESARMFFPDNYDLLDLKLKLIAAKNNEKHVLLVLDEMLRTSPDRYEVHLNKAQYYVLKYQFDKAIEEFDNALKLSDEKYFILDKIVRVYFLKNKPNEAIDRLKSRLEKDKTDSAASQLLAQIYLSHKDYERARNFFRHAIFHNPTWELPYKSLALSFLGEGKPLIAMKVYKKAADTLANKIPMLLSIAELYEDQGKADEALLTYRSILKINPNNILATNNLALLLINTGSSKDKEEALTLVKYFNKIDKPELHDTLGWAYINVGENLKAIEIFTNLVREYPDTALYQYHLGYSFYLSDNEFRAKKHFRLALKSKQAFAGSENAKKLLNTE